MLFVKIVTHFNTFHNFQEDIFNGAIVGSKTGRYGELGLSLIDRNNINDISIVGIAGDDAENSNKVVVYQDGTFITDLYCQDQVAVLKKDEPGITLNPFETGLTIGAEQNRGKLIFIKKFNCYGTLSAGGSYAWPSNDLFTVATCYETNCYVKGFEKEDLIKFMFVANYQSEFENFKIKKILNDTKVKKYKPSIKTREGSIAFEL